MSEPRHTSHVSAKLLHDHIAQSTSLEPEIRRRLLTTSFTPFGFANITVGIPALVSGEEANLLRLDLEDGSPSAWAVHSTGWELGEDADAWGATTVYTDESAARAAFEARRAELEGYASHGAPLRWWEFPLTRDELGVAFKRTGAPHEAMIYNLDELDAYQNREFGPVELELHVTTPAGQKMDVFLLCQELSNGSREYGIRGVHAA